MRKEEALSGNTVSSLQEYHRRKRKGHHSVQASPRWVDIVIRLYILIVVPPTHL